MEYRREAPAVNPLRGMPFGFRDYVRKRKDMESERLSGNGLPDYAFAMDYELRKKLDSIPQLYSLGKKICGTITSRYMQEFNRQALLVGPDQFPEVYRIGCDCARRLGIGIPNIYIYNDPSINAFTYATDDIEPIIVVNSRLYERFTTGELRCVIGHECGHIHNQHGVYDMLGRLLLNGGLQSVTGALSAQLLSLLTLSSQVALSAWSRAAEVTCDRAGMICCERLEDAYQVNAKIMSGAAGSAKSEVNLEALLQSQLTMQMSNMARFEELFASHPSSARRIAAEMEFAGCEVLYRWRPELKEAGQTMRSREETDNRCRRFIDVARKG